MLRTPLFRLGQTVATPGAIALLKETGANAAQLLERHQCGDWGKLPDEDRLSNERAVGGDGRIFSSYPVGAGKLWIITETDRSATTILLPEDY